MTVVADELLQRIGSKKCVTTDSLIRDLREEDKAAAIDALRQLQREGKIKEEKQDCWIAISN
jgi:hypothetical protein